MIPQLYQWSHDTFFFLIHFVTNISNWIVIAILVAGYMLYHLTYSLMKPVIFVAVCLIVLVGLEMAGIIQKNDFIKILNVIIYMWNKLCDFLNLPQNFRA